MNKDILQIIEKDARTTPKQLSAMTGTPTTEITKQIKQAEKERVILKYKTEFTKRTLISARKRPELLEYLDQ